MKQSQKVELKRQFTQYISRYRSRETAIKDDAKTGKGTKLNILHFKTERKFIDCGAVMAEDNA